MNAPSTSHPQAARGVIHRMASGASSACSPLSRRLPARTACGLAFDRLAEGQRRVRQDTPIGTLQWRYEGDHGPTGAASAWTVAWCNGSRRVALTLVPGPGAWAAAQSYFDRAPAALAWSLVAPVFEPWWAARADGPWAASAVGREHYLPGGARGFAALPSHALSFEFRLAFSSAEAAHDIAAPPATPLDEVGIGFAMPCEIRLGRLRLAPDRAVRLGPGDLLLLDPLGGATAPRRQSATDPSHTVLREAVDATAWLCAGTRGAAVALITRHAGHWRVAGFPLRLAKEMDMDEFPFDATDPASPAAALGKIEVAVDIVATRLTMRVEALQALRVGDVIATDHAVDEASVEVRVGGSTCARGTLIAFEGRLAVQLLSVDAMSGVEGSH